MEILVLLKQVPDTEAKLSFSGTKVNESGIKWIISPNDEIAVEEAIRWKEKSGGSVTVVSLGTDQVVSSLRTAYAMGCDNAIHIKMDDYQMLDSLTIAKALVKATEDKKFDVIFAGKVGIDSDNGQVPLMYATLRDYPLLPWAKSVDLQADKAVVESEEEGGIATVEAAYPLVITVQVGLNEPRYPSLKGTMVAKKKPIETKDFASLGIEKSALEVATFEAPPERPKGRIIEGETAEEKVTELIKALREEAGVI